MSSVPPYLNEFGDEDARWLQKHGVQQRVRAGDRVITEGVTPAHLWVVLEGEFRVSSAELRNDDLSRVKAGELLGEMSYINRTPPAATVFAMTDGTLLAVSRKDVDAKIEGDPEFASRFRKVLMEFAVSRLWTYNRRDADPPPPSVENDPYADLRVHELIEKLLRGEF